MYESLNVTTMHILILIPFECELYYNQIMMMENGTVMIKGIILIETLHLYINF